MRKKATRGTCTSCGKEYTRQGMTKHLQGCLIDRLGKEKTAPCFHLLVTAEISDYWLHLQVNASATLKSLDSFLRRIWLECCGHMSMFRYGRDEIAMSRKLNKTLQPDLALDYDYDFGSTTSLKIKVFGEFPGLVTPKRPVEVLARNQAPEIPCDECGKGSAVNICPECQWEGEGWLCHSCAAKHQCGDEEYFLPVVNSPRTGVCGYTG